LSPIIIRLATEEELRAARDKADDMEKENTEMATKLAKKEQELDQLCQEKVSKQLFITPPIFYKYLTFHCFKDLKKIVFLLDIFTSVNLVFVKLFQSKS
jgi:hypothetical protein